MSNFLQGQGLFRSIAKLDSRQAALWARGIYAPSQNPAEAGQFNAEIAEKGRLWMGTK
jgi:hypothetical protein